MMRVLVQRAASRLMTSDGFRRVRCGFHALPRRLTRRSRVVDFFFELDDPYSLLAAHSLEPLADRHRLQWRIHAVPPPSTAESPQRAAWQAWAERDVDRLARHWGLDRRRLVPPRGLDTSATALSAGAARRRRLGHYQGAMFHFEGEWYWGIDRLHHLERRLGVDAPLFAPAPLRFAPSTPDTRPVIHFYCSLRSPYTYLAVGSLQRLARHYGARVVLCPLMPMVKRGVPLSRAKRLYIVRDAKREATRLGLPFGDIVDPLGWAVEQGLAVLHHAMRRESEATAPGMAFLSSFLQGVFAEGVDARHRRALESLMARGGLEAADLALALADSTWREAVDTHRTDLLERGLWGVPSFRVNDLPALWGQDRLWMLEEDLMSARNTS